MPSTRIAIINARQFQGKAARTVKRYLAETGAEIVFAQDFPRDVEENPEFRKVWNARYFEPMTLHFGRGGNTRVDVGLGFFGKRYVAFKKTWAEAYVGNMRPTPELAHRAVEFEEETGRANAKHDPLSVEYLEWSESRIAIGVKLVEDGRTLHLLGTNGPFRPAGLIDDAFRKAMDDLLRILLEEKDPLVACGCFQFPRDGDIYKSYVQHGGLTDCIPAEVKNTVDWNFLVKSGGPDVVSTFIFTRGKVTVSNVKRTFGVSHHAAIEATVEW